jgi:hypothetical protein
MFDENEGLKVRDIVKWKTTDGRTKEFMIYKSITALFGLMDMNTGYDSFRKFTSMDELKEYVLNAQNVEDNKIFHIKQQDWIVYMP